MNIHEARRASWRATLFALAAGSSAAVVIIIFQRCEARRPCPSAGASILLASHERRPGARQWKCSAPGMLIIGRESARDHGELILSPAHSETSRLVGGHTFCNIRPARRPGAARARHLFRQPPEDWPDPRPGLASPANKQQVKLLQVAALGEWRNPRRRNKGPTGRAKIVWKRRRRRRRLLIVRQAEFPERIVNYKHMQPRRSRSWLSIKAEPEGPRANVRRNVRTQTPAPLFFGRRPAACGRLSSGSLLARKSIAYNVSSTWPGRRSRASRREPASRLGPARDAPRDAPLTHTSARTPINPA